MDFNVKYQSTKSWVYILVLVIITILVGGWMIYYAQETIKEINYLSSASYYNE